MAVKSLTLISTWEQPGRIFAASRQSAEGSDRWVGGRGVVDLNGLNGRTS